MIAASTHCAALSSLLAQYASTPVELILTDDIAHWAASTGVVVAGNPVATSIAATSDLPARIVIKEKISEDELSEVVGRLEFSGEWALGSRMRRDPVLFLSHLALHELAHIENNWPQEMEDACDVWASERVSQLPP